MKEKILYIVVAISVGINVGLIGIFLFILINRPFRDFQHFDGRRFDKDGRFENIRSFMDRVDDLNRPYFDKLEEDREKIREILKSDKPDTSILDSFLREQAKTRYFIDKNLTFSIVNFKGKLSEDEKELLNSFIENRGMPKKMMREKKIKIIK